MNRLWARWVAANAAGELIGLGLIAVLMAGLSVAGALTHSRGATLGLALLMILLGGYEGAVVGWMQWRVLHVPLARLHRDAWVGATVLGAIVAWTLGMLPSTLAVFLAQEPGASPPALSAAAELALAALLGAGAGALLAFPQTRVLRHHVERAWVWLPANALAWAAAMPVIFWAMGPGPAGAGPGQMLARLLPTIALAGAVAGAVHGAVLVRLLRHPIAPPPGHTGAYATAWDPPGDGEKEADCGPDRPGRPERVYVWRWRSLHPERFGQRCRMVEGLGASPLVEVEFEDGFRVKAPRPAIRVAPRTEHQ